MVFIGQYHYPRNLQFTSISGSIPREWRGDRALGSHGYNGYHGSHGCHGGGNGSRSGLAIQKSPIPFNLPGWQWTQ